MTITYKVLIIKTNERIFTILEKLLSKPIGFRQSFVTSFFKHDSREKVRHSKRDVRFRKVTETSIPTKSISKSLFPS